MSDEDEYLKLLAYVNISTYRHRVMDYLSGRKYDIPRGIAEAVGIRTNHISMILKDLREHDLVECINPEAHKGRVYRLTSTGGRVMEYAETIQKKNKG